VLQATDMDTNSTDTLEANATEIDKGDNNATEFLVNGVKVTGA